jgi:hypothetical protein
MILPDVRFGNVSPKDFDFLQWLLNSLLCGFSILLFSLTSEVYHLLVRAD